MTEIKIGIFGTDTEISSFTPGEGDVMLVLSERVCGFICISDKRFILTDGKCKINHKLLNDGEILPTVITKEGRLALPTLIKDGNLILPKPLGDGFTRELSARERALEGRVKELEEKVAELMKSVYGTRLFN